MQGLVGITVALVVSGMVAQLAAPYIRRDDWPFLLPRGTSGTADPLDKVREEGRWLGYAWWLLVGQHGTPLTAVFVLVGSYALFAVGFWRLFDSTGWVAGTLLGAALLVSPLWVRLAYWPGTLSASAVVAAAAVSTLPRAARYRWGLAVWLPVVVVLSVLTYPPVAGLLLIAAAVHLRHRAWKGTALLCLGFVGSFALAVLVSFSIDALVFGHFGVAIAAWRHPHAVTSLHDLMVNGHRYVGQVTALGRTLRWPATVGAVCAVVGLADARVRPMLLRVGVAVVLVAGLECAQTLDTGVRTAARGSLWAWPAVVVPAALLLAGRRWSRRVAAVALLCLALLGLHAWHSDLGAHQATRRAYDALVTDATRTGQEVVFYQAPAERRSARGRITEGTLRMMFYERAGVVVHWCSPAQCRELAALAGPRGGGSVHALDGVVGVVVPSPPARL
ncbi:hypothetical protein [Oryzobacter telluris]|uniref:hypothetical protein n=1 Tax=Oryzobacter telluris TaxID=3149179 RepID=UPI00370D1754